VRAARVVTVIVCPDCLVTVIVCPDCPEKQFKRPSHLREALQLRDVHDRLAHGPVGEFAKVKEVAR
jgi:hypothetical protein